MPRLTNTSLSSLARCLPVPGLFPDLTLMHKDSQVNINRWHDLTLVCSDGLITTNQCVMATASSFVRKLLADCHLVEAGRTGRKEDMVTLHLPEVDYTSVIRVVTCFTEGVVRLPLSGGWGDHSVKKKLEAAWRVLGIDKVNLEDIFKNTSVQDNECVEIEEDVVSVDEIVNVKEDVPDRLQTLCATGIISVGGERKRKGDYINDEWAPVIEEEGQNGIEEDASDGDWNPKKSNKRKSVRSRPPKKKKSFDPETVALAKVNVLDKPDVAKPEPTVNVLDESVIVKPEPAPSVSINVLGKSSTEKTKGIGRGRGRPKRSCDLTPSTSTPTRNSRTRSSIFVPAPSSPALSLPPSVVVKTRPSVVQPQSSVSLNKAELSEKRSKIDRTSFALEPSTCFVCLKAEDKDGRVLNMKNLFYLRNHYAKCLYNEGKIFKAVSPGVENTNEDGRPKDEFGMKNGFMYKCNVAGCWLQQKKGTHSQVCYKVYAIHMVSQHGVMERLLEEDKRPEPQRLLEKIRAYERCEVVDESPKRVAEVTKIQVEVAKKKNEAVERVIEVVDSSLTASASSAWDAALVQELIVAENDDDPDNPAELAEITELPEIEPKFVVKTFDRTEDINVFRKVNTNINNPQKMFNIFKPVKVDPSETNPLKVKKKLDEPIPNLDEKYKLSNDGFHTCFLCNGMGKNNKDSHHLSFKNLIKLKEHYARCIYNEGNMYKFVSPGEDNVDNDGRPIDEYGKVNGKMYKCKIQGCWLQRKLGLRGHVCYKVYSIHMSSQHGVLETILEYDARPYMKEILRGIRKEEGGKQSLARCRFDVCKDIQFKVEANRRELKMHYATHHFRKWFEGRDKRGLDRMPTMEFSSKGGTRATCDRCTEESSKPIYIQGDNEAIMGHLVVKHDLLVDALREAGDSVKEARDVVKDLYPDQVTEFYMATLSSKQGAIPLNEDFMDKMFI